MTPAGESGNRRYGVWAGNPEGYPEDVTRCAEQVFPTIGTHCQCVRKRGHGPDGEYCKQHAKKIEAREVLKGAAR